MRRPIAIFIYDLLVIAFLVSIAAAYLKCNGFHACVPDVVRLAVHCAWFGALGGVVISLKGIYDHSGAKAANQWDNSYNLWHFGRPISGAIAGGITYLLLQAINPGGEPTQPVIYAAAFTLGTQERRFFTFISEVARLIVQVPNETKSPDFALITVEPTHGREGELVMLRGYAFTASLIVTIGGNQLEHTIVTSDGTAAAGTLPAHEAGAVDVSIANPDGSRATLRRGFTYLG
jgi:hypothetical protein